MKLRHLFFTILFTLLFAGSCLGSNKIIDLKLSGDLLDSKGVLAAGKIKRSSAATYINEGVLYTADGDDTPFSNASIEDETGATEMRGSFVDSQAWFHDAGGLIAVYAGTGNLLILADPTLKAYGFIGEVGTGETLGAEIITDATNRDFSGAGDWLAGGAATVTVNYDSGDGGHDTTMRVEAGDNSDEYGHLPATTGYSITAEKSYKLTFSYKDVESTDVFVGIMCIL